MRVGIGNRKVGSRLYYVARLVLPTFGSLPANGSMEADHVDGNPLHGCIANLQWLTPRKNKEKTNRGTNNPNARLSDEEVLELWANRYGETTAKGWAVRLGVSVPLVYGIWKGRGWRHLTHPGGDT